MAGPIIEPNIEALLKKVNGGGFAEGGWNAFDDTETQELNEKQKEEIIARRKELSDAVFSAFNTTSGRRVLEWLLDNTLRRASFHPDNLNAVHRGFFREGQNSIVNSIIVELNFAKNPTALKPKGREDGKI